MPVQALCRARVRLKRDRRRREHAALLSAGQNPYEVARRREMEAARRTQERHLAEALRRGRDALTARMVAEEAAHQRRLEAAALEKVFAASAANCMIMHH